MDISTLIPHIEALIFASDKPLTAADIAELTNNAFGSTDDRITPEQVGEAIGEISAKYHGADFPFEMRESGGGWQFLTKKDFHKTVVQLNGEKYLKRLSAASLETLAIIAYKQPITKGEIESIRGVNSDYSIQKLLEKELIVITGRNEDLPGKPLIYSTSRSFMDYFGINSADELPRIREVLSGQAAEPTVVNTTEEDTATGDYRNGADDVLLVVRGNGELIEEPNVVVHTDAGAIDPAEAGSPGEEKPEDDINREIEINMERTIREGNKSNDTDAPPDDQPAT